MNFDVYCDESRPDVFCSKNPAAHFLVIGSLWMPRDARVRLKTVIHELRAQHKVGGEFKWQKASPSRLEFYKSLVTLFFSEGSLLRYRCIAVDRRQIDPQRHNNDHELGFYKFYYQLLHHWICEGNSYKFFCDFKLNRDMSRLPVLKKCLQSSNLFATVEDVQAVDSAESVLIQLTDVLTGAASARLNGTLGEGTAKSLIVNCIEERLSRKIESTSWAENKFNVFEINLKGGW